MSINCLQRTGIANSRAIEKLLPEQKIVNEQKVKLLTTARNIGSSPHNAKPNVVGS